MHWPEPQSKESGLENTLFDNQTLSSEYSLALPRHYCTSFRIIMPQVPGFRKPTERDMFGTSQRLPCPVCGAIKSTKVSLVRHKKKCQRRYAPHPDTHPNAVPRALARSKSAAVTREIQAYHRLTSQWTKRDRDKEQTRKISEPLP